MLLIFLFVFICELSLIASATNTFNDTVILPDIFNVRLAQYFYNGIPFMCELSSWKTIEYSHSALKICTERYYSLDMRKKRCPMVGEKKNVKMLKKKIDLKINYIREYLPHY